MNVECPNCSARGKIRDETVPLEGREVSCPRCGRRFRVWPERSPVEIIQQRERVVCPKCGSEQDFAETCVICGVDVKAYRRIQARQAERESLEFMRLRSEVRQANSWYRELFDQRLGTLMVRVLSLLVGIVILATCTLRMTDRARIEALNAVEKKKAEEGTPPRTATYNDQGFKDRFDYTVTEISHQTDECFTQVYGYVTQWYQRGGEEHYLTPHMEQALRQIKRNHSEVRANAEGLPTPTKPYWECRQKVQRLYNIYDDVYKLATDYRPHYSDLSDKLAGLSADYFRVREELNACKQSFK